MNGGGGFGGGGMNMDDIFSQFGDVFGGGLEEVSAVDVEEVVGKELSRVAIFA
jgi:hypothetical protein